MPSNKVDLVEYLRERLSQISAELEKHPKTVLQANAEFICATVSIEENRGTAAEQKAAAILQAASLGVTLIAGLAACLLLPQVTAKIHVLIPLLVLCLGLLIKLVWRAVMVLVPAHVIAPSAGPCFQKVKGESEILVRWLAEMILVYEFNRPINTAKLYNYHCALANTVFFFLSAISFGAVLLIVFFHNVHLGIDVSLVLSIVAAVVALGFDLVYLRCFNQVWNFVQQRIVDRRLQEHGNQSTEKQLIAVKQDGTQQDEVLSLKNNIQQESAKKEIPSEETQ